MFPNQSQTELQDRLNCAFRARQPHLFPGEHQALRLFNGFSEGCPELTVELFGETLVIFDYSRPPHDPQGIIQSVVAYYGQVLPWTKTVIVKSRFSPSQSDRWGKLLFGKQPDRKIRETGIWYAIDLLINQDASFYLDTRNLRKWALEHLRGKRVLNTFAYTGSLGVAAKAGGADLVLQLDRNRRFLNLARTSYKLNDFEFNPSEFLTGDFFTWMGRLKRTGGLFDCIFLDPPFFSVTAKGRVDQTREPHRLINKVRPLIAKDGWLVAINNSLFTSGETYNNELNKLCADGYLAMQAMIPVPCDVTGYPDTVVSHPPSDPAPFNHATKIALLRVTQRRD